MDKVKGLGPACIAVISCFMMPLQAQAAISADVMGLSQRCAPSVHPATMAYVVSHESANNPYAIGINDGPRLTRQPTSEREAIAIAERLYAEGRSFDMGLGQVHSGNLPGLGLSVVDLFDPCQNLRAAAVILEGCFERTDQGLPEQMRLRQALSCYNTNSMSAGFSNGYVDRVTSLLAHAVPQLQPLGGGGGEMAGPVRLQASTTSPEPQPAGGDVFDARRPDAFTKTPGERKELPIADDNRSGVKTFFDSIQVTTERD